MKKAAIYTRTGDRGTTGLVGGARIKKSDPRIHLYGEVDELNSHVGVGLSLLKENFNRSFLQRIQSMLFDLGSNLACEKELREKFKLPSIDDSFITELEHEIDLLDSKLVTLKNFVLPGGAHSAAVFHVCRTVCRRVERQMVDFEENHPGEVPEKGLLLMNRLSDYFFVLARFLNASEKVEEILWAPSKST